LTPGLNALKAQNLSDDFLLVQSVPLETKLEESKLPRAYDVWMDMINNSSYSIDIEMFYFANQKDSPLEKVYDALKKAAGRGVKIRIIIDSSFYSRSDKSSDELEGINNIEIRKIPVGNLTHGIMHAKYFVVDRETLFVGSQNFDWRALIHIHEMGVKVKSKKLAATFGKIFELDWGYCVSHDDSGLMQLGKSKAKVLNSKNILNISTDYFGKISLYPAFSPYDLTPKKFSYEEKEIVKLINKTKSRLYIQIYSFSDKGGKGDDKFNSFEKAIKAAAKRGVDIRLILPDWAMKKSAVEFLKNLSLVKNVQIKISTIPEYSGGFISYARVEHCKYFISDNKTSFVSTSNWEYNYFYESRNASLVIKNKKVNSELEEVFMRDWSGPYTELIDLNKDYKPSKRN
jgi:phosphatidylserine/phosphatidylglycerophosphate/cardiolipin synthase-like enzyme